MLTKTWEKVIDQKGNFILITTYIKISRLIGIKNNFTTKCKKSNFFNTTTVIFNFTTLSYFGWSKNNRGLVVSRTCFHQISHCWESQWIFGFILLFTVTKVEILYQATNSWGVDWILPAIIEDKATNENSILTQNNMKAKILRNYFRNDKML